EMSAAEAELRLRPDGAGEEYFERMTESVMAKIGSPGREAVIGATSRESAASAPGAPEPRTHARRGDYVDVPRVERRRPDSSIEDPEPRRRLHLPWIGIGGGAVAAVAVVVVAVVLFQRQNEWVRAPRPAEVGEPGSEPRADSLHAERQESSNGVAGATAGARPRDVGLAREKTAAKKSDRDRLLAKSEKAPPPSAGAVSGGGDVLLKDQASEIRAQATPQALRAPVAEGDRKLMASQNAAPEAAPRGAAAPGEAYANLLRAYRLPPAWNPGVPGDAVARAETNLRYLYQTGRAGADSARIRLYLAEAERARLTDPSNTAAVESISHHYRRAISLAGGDATLAATARRRLAEFEQEMTRARGTQP
ncbi:MAG TPA: hypothetical protein VL503_01930, partial [Candidatus Omnitrophota bacterium]|nr:hypothetical protein [Candidatus Omnitrophota bacterium]